MTLEELRAALSDEEEEVRYRALRLCETHAPETSEGLLRLLLEALGDPAWRVRSVAGACLVRIGGAEACRRLVTRLAEGEDAAARNAAAEALVHAGALAVPALLEASPSDRDQAKFVVDVLGEIGDPRALDHLVAALREADPNLRVAAAEALGKVGGAEAVRAVEELLSEPDLVLRLAALGALERMEAVVPYPRLSALLDDRLLRRPALALLARCEAEAALDTIVEAFADPSQGTREAALRAAGAWVRHFDPDRSRLERSLTGVDEGIVVRAVRDGLESDDLATRHGALQVASARALPQVCSEVLGVAADERLEAPAIDALTRMGSEVTPALLEAATDLSPAARRVVFGALARLGEEVAIGPLVAALDEGDDLLRIDAARALGELGDPRAVEPLARLLGRPRRTLAHTVVAALARLAEVSREEVLEVCRQRLGDEDPLRVTDAVALIGAVGTVAELPLLEVALSHPDPRVRREAVRAVGARGGVEAVHLLRTALADESAEVRGLAVEALITEVGRPQAIEPLRAATQDEDAQVAARAVEGLGRLGDLESEALLLDRLDAKTSPTVVLAAMAALEAVGSERFAGELEHLVRHPEAEVVKEAIAAAVRLDVPNLRALLLGVLDHPAWDVRRAAVLGLGRRRDPSLRGPLQDRLAREQDAMVVEALHTVISELEEGSA